MCAWLCCPGTCLQAIFEEFNTLSVVYQQPAALFVQSAQYQLQEEEPEPQQVCRVPVSYSGWNCLSQS
jgi:hypothetical protein